MNRKLIALLLSVVIISACVSTQLKPVSITHRPALQGEGVYPTGPTCSKLADAKWSDISLYDLTYGCMPAGWDSFFRLQEVRTQINNISDTITAQVKNNYRIGPAIGNTFKALYLVKPDNIKAVIMGQDPAPQPGLATGLAFSTEPNVSSSKVASIQRVLLESQNEGNCINLDNGNLTKWAQNGTLLLNMALTIPCPPNQESCTIGGHIPLWGNFTSYLIAYINKNAGPTAFILWGNQAGQYEKDVTNKIHTVLKGGHPSPQAPGENFFCKNYFNCANKWLTGSGRSPIDWDLIDKCTAATPCIWTWHPSTRTSSCSKECTLMECK